MQRRDFLKISAQIVMASAVLNHTMRAANAQEEAPQASTAPDDMRLFLLIGQSNMAGRGKPEAQDKVTDPRIWMMNQEMNWVPAKDPVHFDKPIAGVGLASEFARTLVAREPQIKIGLIPCAMGGSKLDEWIADGELFTNAVTRTCAAMKNGTLTGILWHQGEADSNADKVATYAARFAPMIAQLRARLHAQTVPVVMGELVQSRPENAAFNAALPAISAAVPNCDWVSSQGLEDRGDKLHFSPASYRELGRRYAAKFLEMEKEGVG